jgi:hypothetical protein
MKVSKNGSEQEEKYLVAHLEEARGTPVDKHCYSQCFSTGGSRPTFGSPKPLLYYYNSNKWVAKIVYYSVLWVANYPTLRTTDLNNTWHSKMGANGRVCDRVTKHCCHLGFFELLNRIVYFRAYFGKIWIFFEIPNLNLVNSTFFSTKFGLY